MQPRGSRPVHLHGIVPLWIRGHTCVVGYLYEFMPVHTSFWLHHADVFSSEEVMWHPLLLDNQFSCMIQCVSTQYNNSFGVRLEYAKLSLEKCLDIFFGKKLLTLLFFAIMSHDAMCLNAKMQTIFMALCLWHSYDSFGLGPYTFVSQPTQMPYVGNGACPIRMADHPLPTDWDVLRCNCGVFPNPHWSCARCNFVTYKTQGRPATYVF